MRSSRGAKQARVRAAIEAVNLDELIANMDSVTLKNDNLIIDLLKADDISQEKRTMLMNLLESNMRTQYENSPSGWDEAEKYAEMFDTNSRHLVISSRKCNSLVAFCHFRFDMDYGEDVVYCYEIQIHTDWRRQGLGR